MSKEFHNCLSIFDLIFVLGKYVVHTRASIAMLHTLTFDRSLVTKVNRIHCEMRLARWHFIKKREKRHKNSNEIK